MSKKTSSSAPPASTTEAKTPAEYQVKFAPDAAGDLDQISDQRTVGKILKRAGELKSDPMRQGKALTDELKGYRSVRAAGQRYRIVYRVFEIDGEVVIVVVGIRKAGDKTDAYAVAEKRLS
jgi:mRNA interferase RelE/StbE